MWQIWLCLLVVAQGLQSRGTELFLGCSWFLGSAATNFTSLDRTFIHRLQNLANIQPYIYFLAFSLKCCSNQNPTGSLKPFPRSPFGCFSLLYKIWRFKTWFISTTSVVLVYIYFLGTVGNHPIPRNKSTLDDFTLDVNSNLLEVAHLAT